VMLRLLAGPQADQRRLNVDFGGKVDESKTSRWRRHVIYRYPAAYKLSGVPLSETKYCCVGRRSLKNSTDPRSAGTASTGPVDLITLHTNKVAAGVCPSSLANRTDE
jgi:hypothetical protein